MVNKIQFGLITFIRNLISSLIIPETLTGPFDVKQVIFKIFKKKEKEKKRTAPTVILDNPINLGLDV